MADANTTTYSFVKPEVGASEDTWGTKWNTTLDQLDDLFDGTTTVTGIKMDDTMSIVDNADGTKVAQFQVSGISTATTRTYTFPDASMTFVGADTAQTLTNKTMDLSANTVTVDGTNAVGYLGIPQSGSAKTTSYSLATTDVGELVVVGTGGSITIPDATFSAGDAVVIANNTSGNITITCTITTAYIGGTDTDKATVTLATRGVCNVLFLSGTACIITGNVS